MVLVLKLRLKTMLGLDRSLMQPPTPQDNEDELDESLDDRRLGNWEEIGWLAASMTRRVPGVEFMSVAV